MMGDNNNGRDKEDMGIMLHEKQKNVALKDNCHVFSYHGGAVK